MRENLIAASRRLDVGCFSMPTTKAANTSYSTEDSVWPIAPTGLNPPVRVGFAKEVFIGGRRERVLTSGTDAISDENWPRHIPDISNGKNSDRHWRFTTSCFSRTPVKPADCAGHGCRDVLDMAEYTWVGVTRIDADAGVPSAKANPDGLYVVMTEKLHECHSGTSAAGAIALKEGAGTDDAMCLVFVRATVPQ